MFNSKQLRTVSSAILSARAAENLGAVLADLASKGLDITGLCPVTEIEVAIEGARTLFGADDTQARAAIVEFLRMTQEAPVAAAKVEANKAKAEAEKAAARKAAEKAAAIKAAARKAGEEKAAAVKAAAEKAAKAAAREAVVADPAFQARMEALVELDEARRAARPAPKGLEAAISALEAAHAAKVKAAEAARQAAFETKAARQAAFARQAEESALLRKEMEAEFAAEKAAAVAKAKAEHEAAEREARVLFQNGLTAWSEKLLGKAEKKAQALAEAFVAAYVATATTELMGKVDVIGLTRCIAQLKAAAATAEAKAEAMFEPAFKAEQAAEAASFRLYRAAWAFAEARGFGNAKALFSVEEGTGSEVVKVALGEKAAKVFEETQGTVGRKISLALGAWEADILAARAAAVKAADRKEANRAASNLPLTLKMAFAAKGAEALVAAQATLAKGKKVRN